MSGSTRSSCRTTAARPTWTPACCPAIACERFLVSTSGARSTTPIPRRCNSWRDTLPPVGSGSTIGRRPRRPPGRAASRPRPLPPRTRPIRSCCPTPALNRETPRGWRPEAVLRAAAARGFEPTSCGAGWMGWGTVVAKSGRPVWRSTTLRMWLRCQPAGPAPGGPLGAWAGMPFSVITQAGTAAGPGGVHHVERLDLGRGSGLPTPGPARRRARSAAKARRRGWQALVALAARRSCSCASSPSGVGRTPEGSPRPRAACRPGAGPLAWARRTATVRVYWSAAPRAEGSVSRTSCQVSSQAAPSAAICRPRNGVRSPAGAPGAMAGVPPSPVDSARRRVPVRG